MAKKRVLRKKEATPPAEAPNADQGAAPPAEQKAPTTDEGLTRTVLPDGIIVEDSAGMGRSFLVPADPHPRRLDLSANAPGWDRLGDYLRRRQG
jgi:hypothetical protein